ncbi:MAG: hypothetical protein HYT93_03200 [Parcubacteria group bacterium]|nr:hypothetical protein [Parcubacteria group bacterium]
MQSKVILGIVLVLLVVVGGLFFFNKKAAAPETNSMQEVKQEVSNTPLPSTLNKAGEKISATVVTYTKDGFSPETVEIKAGETVMFKNESELSLWVASAIHPTHSLYPKKSSSDCLGSSFDACAVTAPGSSWSFAFTEVGSWNYHNHIQANHRGTITVK